MLIKDIRIKPGTIAETVRVNEDLRKTNMPKFPVIVMGTDSYIASGSIMTLIDYPSKDIMYAVHNIQIGKYCSLSHQITFLVNANHDYPAITTSPASFMEDFKPRRNLPHKGQILIQNDVWIGYGCTIMSGVTIHNGAVVATGSVVKKDVPPYAIVGGNPARVIKYRFTPEQITQMLQIAWWDWPTETLKARKEDFSLGIDEFIRKYAPQCTKPAKIDLEKDKTTYLLIPDFDDPYPVYEWILKEYCKKFGEDKSNRLLIYIKDDPSTKDRHLELLNQVLSKYYTGNGDILIRIENPQDERALFTAADYYITTRSLDTVRYSCYADLMGVKIVSGVDWPIFRQ